MAPVLDHFSFQRIVLDEGHECLDEDFYLSMPERGMVGESGGESGGRGSGGRVCGREWWGREGKG